MSDIGSWTRNGVGPRDRGPSGSLSKLWAKTSRGLGDVSDIVTGGQPWLSLSQHSRDAADVGTALARQWLAPSVRSRLVLSLGCQGDPGAVDRLLGWLAGVHDVGKAEVGFQHQAARSKVSRFLWDQVAPLLEDARMEDDRYRKVPHSLYSELIIRRWLRRCFPDADILAIASVAVIAGCHHGVPSGLPWQLSTRFNFVVAEAESWLDRHGEQWSGMWWELLDDLTSRTGVQQDLERLLQAGGIAVADQIFLSGFVSMADWVASNQELFPLSQSGSDSRRSFRADEALERLNLTRPWEPASPKDIVDVRQRFDWGPDRELRPVQRKAMDIAATATGPTLLIIEDETGSGKTEAAQLAGEVLAARTGAGGMAFALPTMTTTDALLPRMVGWVQRLSDSRGQHSIRLMHSKANLNPAFEELLRATKSVNDDEAQENSQAAEYLDHVVAHAWFSGRKGVLSEFLVCTVDQILMAALATRYVTLRHLGLAGKVVVVDEVHSYDVYSSNYLARALTWLAAQGASVILLSATLASGPRNLLSAAYREGLRQTERPAEMSAEKLRTRTSLRAKMVAPGPVHDGTHSPCVDVAYPRITTVSCEGVTAEHVPVQKACRQVFFSLIGDSDDELIAEVERLSQSGGVIGIVCNTVARAQQAAAALAGRYPGSVELFHSQFIAADRARKEQELTTRLGTERPGAASSRPRFHIVVGTQVLEQSLDVDFDALISDMAPTDSLAQRAGRLHRHSRLRPPGLEHAQLVLRGMDLDKTTPTFDRGSEFIYGKRVLMATAAILFRYISGEPWCAGHDLPSDVEATYSDSTEIPSDWQEEYNAASNKEAEEDRAAKKRAQAFQLKTPVESRGKLTQALSALSAVDADRQEDLALATVRDIDPSLEVALIRRVRGRLLPLPWLTSQDWDEELSPVSVPSERIIHVIADSVVRLPRALIRPDQIMDAMVELDDAGFGAWQRDFRLRGTSIIVLDEQLCGSILGKSFRYDKDLGVVPTRNHTAPTPNEGGQDAHYRNDI
nr:CRISPR-associated helicase Cas3' [Bowdeniella nasicola]